MLIRECMFVRVHTFDETICRFHPHFLGWLKDVKPYETMWNTPFWWAFHSFPCFFLVCCVFVVHSVLVCFHSCPYCCVFSIVFRPNRQPFSPEKARRKGVACLISEALFAQALLLRVPWKVGVDDFLVGGWPTPLKKRKVRWDYASQRMEK
jgi:hypothetical protein